MHPDEKLLREALIRVRKVYEGRKMPKTVSNAEALLECDFYDEGGAVIAEEDIQCLICMR